MPRLARVVAIGLPHHITQRGNYRQNIFHKESDRNRYLSWLREYSDKYKLSLLAYCLMDNHVHFIAIPGNKDSLSKTFNFTHMRYSQYVNRSFKTTGHLWQGRFYSCVLDQAHLTLAARYVERNPVRTKIVNQPWQWKWSSAQNHIDGKKENKLKMDNLFDYVEMSPETWKAYISASDNGKDIELLRKKTMMGRPAGTPDFIKQLENKFKRRLSALPTGRPKRNGTKK